MLQPWLWGSMPGRAAPTQGEGQSDNRTTGDQRLGDGKSRRWSKAERKSPDQETRTEDGQVLGRQGTWTRGDRRTWGRDKRTGSPATWGSKAGPWLCTECPGREQTNVENVGRGRSGQQPALKWFRKKIIVANIGGGGRWGEKERRGGGNRAGSQ